MSFSKIGHENAELVTRPLSLEEIDWNLLDLLVAHRIRAAKIWSANRERHFDSVQNSDLCACCLVCGAVKTKVDN
eukprot:SAG31_NODE_776_length_12175_cov_9.349122_4_plen_75_part_00